MARRQNKTEEAHGATVQYKLLGELFRVGAIRLIQWFMFRCVTEQIGILAFVKYQGRIPIDFQANHKPFCYYI
jgi:hypothetical protein